MLRNLLRLVLIWTLSGAAAPAISRTFYRMARRAPEGSFLEATLVELSSRSSATLVRVVAEVLTGLTIDSITFMFRLAAELRVRPSKTNIG